MPNIFSDNSQAAQEAMNRVKQAEFEERLHGESTEYSRWLKNEARRLLGQGPDQEATGEYFSEYLEGHRRARG